MQKGLVMEGGAMRGMFTAGVCDVLLENGIDFDGAIGVSAGATFGCNFKSKQLVVLSAITSGFRTTGAIVPLKEVVQTSVLFQVLRQSAFLQPVLLKLERSFPVYFLHPSF
ncbi:MAG: patatin-like phospholipase family protein [Treponema sp.]|nr:patatin-like phospholipase family protein [Treponema sp.]